MVKMAALQKTRVKVVYYSKTGNTKKVAEAIAAELKGEAKDVVKSGTLGYDMRDCDLLFVGSGKYPCGAGKELVDFLEGMKTSEGKFGAVFGTYGIDNSHIRDMKRLLEAKGLKVIGEWSCPGQEYSLINKGRPNEKDIEDARNFASKLLKKIEII